MPCSRIIDLERMTVQSLTMMQLRTRMNASYIS